MCVNAILEKKAGRLVILNVKEISSFADYFIICDGASDRQVQAIAAAAEEQSAASEEINRGVEEVNRVSLETAEAMRQSATAITELSRQAQDLSRLIDELKSS
jgi:ABC-type transporter Mla subunit MlaD